MTHEDPLKKSLPRSTSGWSSRSIFFQSDSYHSPNPYQAPMPGAPSSSANPQVEPLNSGKGFTSRPRDVMGAVGSSSEAPTLGKMFGTPQDARMYKEPEGYSGPMGGPGTSKKDAPRFEYPAVGDSTTKGDDYGRLSPSGSGLRDQADKRVGLENYHPQVGTSPTVSGRRRYFR